MKRFSEQIEKILLSPIHPFLFVAYYIFRMYAINIHDIPFDNFLRPFFVSIFITGFIFFMFYIFIKSKHICAFMTSFLLFMFFFYQQFFSLFLSFKLGIGVIGFIIVYTIITLLVIFWVGQSGKANINLNVVAGINVMGIILLLFPTMQSIRYVIANQIPFIPKVSHVVQDKPLEIKPDIYYIILDSYPRTDVLAEIYEYDNTPFIQSLKDMGFYIAECSQSNYTNTAQSLASSLSLDYVQNLSDSFQPDEVELMGLFKLLDENTVEETVSNFGYKTVAFSSGFLWAEWRDADVFISPPDGPITEFETVLLFSSYLRILDDIGILNYEDLHAERFRTRTRLVLNSFDDLIKIHGPKFVFIHLIVPHAPFAFDEVGNPIPPDEADPKYGYSDQVKFINKFITPQLRLLIEESPNPPVIILQGDHGPLLPDDHTAQMKILNAYFLPNSTEVLYPSISPVNTFRVIFNEYFDANFPLIEDTSYYSDLSRRYNFSVISNTCPQE